MKLTSLHKARYGQWGGQPNGQAADPERCAFQVFPAERGGIHHQCNRKRGHGPEGAYCKQHNPAAQAARDAKSRAKYDLDSWHRWGRAHAKGRIADVAVEMLHQRATMDDLDAAVSEYESKCAEMDRLRASVS